MTHTYDFIRYLEAKKSVDDRALNRQVWEALWCELPPSSRQHPLQLLEIGAGTGNMIQRFIDSRQLQHTFYMAIDADAQVAAVLQDKLPAWHAQLPHFIVTNEVIDLYDFIDQASPVYDLLMAHAFLDLVDLNDTLPCLFQLLKPAGLFYFTLNFNGVTNLSPPTSLGRAFDEQVEQLYHHTMDERAGHSCTGRRLLSQVRAAGGQVLAAGGSDWVVFSGVDGQYQADEAYFLHHILHFFEQSLTGHPALPPASWSRWLAERHAQIECGALVYIAHQIDLLGHTPDS